MTLYAWIGNFWIVLGTMLIPRSVRAASACLLAGNVSWAAYGVTMEDPSIIFICLFLCLVNGVNWLSNG